MGSSGEIWEIWAGLRTALAVKVMQLEARVHRCRHQCAHVHPKCESHRRHLALVGVRLADRKSRAKMLCHTSEGSNRGGLSTARHRPSAEVKTLRGGTI